MAFQNSLQSMLASPGAGGAFTFATQLGQTMTKKGAADIENWRKWESDTVRAYRKAADTNKQNYQAYKVDLQNWFSKSNYVEELRQYEELKAKQAAEIKTETSISATRDLGRKLASLEARFYEQEAADEVQLDSIRLQSIANSVKKVASGQVGRTVENIRNTANQQYLQNASNRLITRQYRIADKLDAGKAFSIEAQNKTNSVRLYNPRPYADPVKPMAPLAAQVYGPSKPSKARGLTLGDVSNAAAAAIGEYKSMLPPSTERSGSGSDTQETTEQPKETEQQP
jgi:hypothetical protein